MAHRCTVLSRRISVDAGRTLSGLPSDGIRSKLVRILVAVACSSILGDRAAMVLVAAARTRYCGGRAVSVHAWRRQTTWRLLRGGGRASRTVFHRARSDLGARVSAVRRDLQALGLGPNRTVRLSVRPPPALCRLFFRRSGHWRGWNRARVVAIRRNAVAPVDALVPSGNCYIYLLDAGHRADDRY